ncbi:MAG: NfeD family protein [Actinobacteria bacterium]|nr:NfeD family protein [Actinomycetota bacterium]
MSLVIGTILSFIFLEPPWRYLALIPLMVWEVFEIWLYLRWRGVRSITGVEAIAGTLGRITRTCRPEGQVHLNGQLWTARCEDGADAGDEVEVIGVDGLTLIVRKHHPAAR